MNPPSPRPAESLPLLATRTFISDLPQHLDERATVYGWVTAVRDSASILFLSVQDRTGGVQVVVRGSAKAALTELSPQSAVRVEGSVKTSSSARYGLVEVDAHAVHVVAPARPRPAGQNGRRANLDQRPRHLDLRSRENFLIFEVQTAFEAAVREALLVRRFIEIHTPKITAGGSESGAEVFHLPYFGANASLTQSPQFYVQLAMSAGFDRVFEVGPVFRAEPAVTRRHATEFTSIDVEMSWIETHEELMACEEELLRYALGAVRDAHGAEIERCFGVEVEVPQAIPRMSLAEALTLIGHDGDDLGPSGKRISYQAEQEISKAIRESTGSSFVFLTDFPSESRPFYTMRDGHRSLSFDLLWRGLEITSGCQREHRYDRLRAQAQAIGIDVAAPQTYLEEHYLEQFRDGCPPHGGFGIGLNRVLMALLGRPAISDTTFVHRGPDRFVP